MAELDVQADGEHRYAATVRTASGTTTEHVVTCDGELLARLEATSADEPFLVRRVLEVLARAADDAEASGSGERLPTVIDLRELDRERPGLLPSLPLR